MANKNNGDPEKDKKSESTGFDKVLDDLKSGITTTVEEGTRFDEYSPAYVRELKADIELAKINNASVDEIKEIQNKINEHYRGAFYNRANDQRDSYNNAKAGLNHRIEKSKDSKERARLKNQLLSLEKSRKEVVAEYEMLAKPRTKMAPLDEKQSEDIAKMGGWVHLNTESVTDYDYEAMGKALISEIPDSELSKEDNPDEYTEEGYRKDYGFKKISGVGYKGMPEKANPFNMTFEIAETTQRDREDEAEDDKLNTDVDYEKFEYEDNATDGIGLEDYLLPAGQAIVGAIGANEPLSDPTMSPEMRTIIDEDMARRNQGLSPAELDYRNAMAGRNYSADVSMIKGKAGGSAGAYLGALGQAGQRLQDTSMRTAAEDEMMRRQNRQVARGAATNAENFERYAFGYQNQEEMLNAQAAGQLMNTGFQEIKDTRAFERNYGEGSAVWDYMKTLRKDKALSVHEREQGMENIEHLLQMRADKTALVDENNKTEE